MEIRRLFPDAGTLEAARALDDLRLGDAAPDDRPYVVANMVASADGRATLDGASAGLSGPADRALFHALRGQVDAVLAGTGTLRAERYRRLIRQPERREERRARGLAPDPLAVVLSRSGDLPDIELLSDPEQPAGGLHRRRRRPGVGAAPRPAGARRSQPALRGRPDAARIPVRRRARRRAVPRPVPRGGRRRRAPGRWWDLRSTRPSHCSSCICSSTTTCCSRAIG